ncbi:hypothetical protein K437DRAFT_256712 [Tilletiaria anomala UBC 951]|uniref:Uncharacterized protein n=1 Tax=Tilletiaria anomala (strain ATCC 24038 / CBS 436.72 / UBC 951) TaxID=1037660 RepID=A0A066VU63_TILAU|nr:uncharacterized protein K437DRAFT_256712 [Tilletiaria anomala UBC 951]KDN45262.1 hypothetical protein K437DRAFT_256712 [Tilletiaria anomala UBC 951]
MPPRAAAASAAGASTHQPTVRARQQQTQASFSQHAQAHQPAADASTSTASRRMSERRRSRDLSCAANRQTQTQQPGKPEECDRPSLSQTAMNEGDVQMANVHGNAADDAWSTHTSQGRHAPSSRNQSQLPPGAHVEAFASGQTRVDKQMPSATVDQEDIIWAGIPDWLLTLTHDGHPVLRATQVALDEKYIVCRLVQLARFYLNPSVNVGAQSTAAGKRRAADDSEGGGSGVKRKSDALGVLNGESSSKGSSTSTTSDSEGPHDVMADYVSASLYAHLALCLDRSSVAARKTLALAVLNGGDPFPFAPSSPSGSTSTLGGTGGSGATTSVSSAAAAHTNASSAQSALRILEQGGQATYEDVESALVYAQACRRLGRYRDAEMALSWTFQRHINHDISTADLNETGHAHSSSTYRSVSSAPIPPPLQVQHASPNSSLNAAIRGSDLSNAVRAQMLVMMGSLALSSNRQKDAVESFQTAHKLFDHWCWSAWAGFCDAGGATSELDEQDLASTLSVDRAGALSETLGDRSDTVTAARAFDAHKMAWRHRAMDFLPPGLERKLKREAARIEEGLLDPQLLSTGDDDASSIRIKHVLSSSEADPAARRLAARAGPGRVAQREELGRPNSFQSRTQTFGAKPMRVHASSSTIDNSDATSVSTVRSHSRLATRPPQPRPGTRTVTGPNGTTAPAVSKRSRSGAETPNIVTSTGRLGGAGSRRTTSAAAVGSVATTGNENSRPGTSSTSVSTTLPPSLSALNKPPAANTRSGNSQALLGPGRTNLHPEQPRATRGSESTSAASSVKDDKEIDVPGGVRRSTRAVSTGLGVTTKTRPAGKTTAMTRGPSRTPVSSQGTQIPTTARRTVGKGPVAKTDSGAARRGAPVKKTLSGTLARNQPHSSSSDIDAALESDQLADAAQARFDAMNKLKEEASKAINFAVLEAKRWTKVDAAIVDMLRVVGEAYRSVRAFRGKRAIWLLRSIPNDIQMEHASMTIDQVVEPGEKQVDLTVYKVLNHRIRSSPPIQLLIGRAYHDMSLYAEAERYFEAAKTEDPTITASMDIYALVLFHLNREVALSALAQELMLLDSRSAIAHLATGNAFSLQREHDLALRCFRRAILLAPSCAYAYTLAGLESLELRNRDDARNFFRAAIRCERRHWNAWSGLGQICLLDEQYPYAEFHYLLATSINRQNAVLWDLLGWVLEMKNEKYAALTHYNKALSLNPSMAMTILRRGELLQKLGRVQEAHESFLKACTLAPDEARVHILLATSYMRLAGGYFAPLDRSEEEANEAGDMSSMMDAAGFVRKHAVAGGAAGRDAAVKATGSPKYGKGYEMAIAHHLAVAIDLDPRTTRTIKAMGEGVHAALQSAAKRGGIFDQSGIASRSVSLNDASTSQFARTSIIDNSRGLPVYQDAPSAANGAGDASNSAAQYVEPDEPSFDDNDEAGNNHAHPLEQAGSVSGSQDGRSENSSDQEHYDGSEARGDESMEDHSQGDRDRHPGHSESNSSSMMHEHDDDVDMSGVP